jgi:multidrug efflux system membrane fusion protein
MSRATLLGLLSLSVLAGCSPPPEPPEAAAPTPVHVVTPTSGPGAPTIVSAGVIAASETLVLSFKVGGVVGKVAVNEGDRVRKGQLLAELVPTEVNAQVTQARQLNDKAARDLARGEKLHADQVIPLEQLEALRTQAAVAAAQLQAALFNGGQARITAPANGIVLRKRAEAQEVVAPGQAIVELGENERGYIVKAGLADREAVQVKVGDAASVTLDAVPGRSLTGKVSEIGGAALAESGLFPVEITLDPADVTLVSGLVAQVSVQPAGNAAPLLRIPTGAVVSGTGDRASVFLLDRGIARKRGIEVAFFTRDQVAVRAGLDATDQVITDGTLYLSDGESVQVQAE